MYDNILLCLDGSNLAEQILPHVTDLASRFGSRVVLMEVVADVPITVAPGDPQVVVAQFGRIPRAKHEAESYLKSVAELLRGKGLKVECVVLEGPVGETISQYAEKSGMDLIAIATHGRSGLGRAVFGSVADYVLRHSRLPVLSIRPRDIEK